MRATFKECYAAEVCKKGNDRIVVARQSYTTTKNDADFFLQQNMQSHNKELTVRILLSQT
jgi:hypothetical protein